MRTICALRSTRHLVSAAESTRSSEAPPPPVRALNPAQKHRLTALAQEHRRRQAGLAPGPHCRQAGLAPEHRHRQVLLHPDPCRRTSLPQLPGSGRRQGRHGTVLWAGHRRTLPRRSHRIRTRSRRTIGMLPRRNLPTHPARPGASGPWEARHQTPPATPAPIIGRRWSRVGGPSPMPPRGQRQGLRSLPQPPTRAVRPRPHRHRVRRRTDRRWAHHRRARRRPADRRRKLPHRRG